MKKYKWMYRGRCPWIKKTSEEEAVLQFSCKDQVEFASWVREPVFLEWLWARRLEGSQLYIWCLELWVILWRIKGEDENVFWKEMLSAPVSPDGTSSAGVWLVTPETEPSLPRPMTAESPGFHLLFLTVPHLFADPQSTQSVSPSPFRIGLVPTWSEGYTRTAISNLFWFHATHKLIAKIL